MALPKQENIILAKIGYDNNIKITSQDKVMKTLHSTEEGPKNNVLFGYCKNSKLRVSLAYCTCICNN